ncbi:hypothetical protein [Sorangium cellulosum]|uniref:Uncharacterized protein n=1 Tax=Sorangium cellulosum TaxID=56 RepID=A0A150QGG4_SORCE|nr:hypothetical protein [Sorangium cellulosum]KYF66826.1 hypothetical protein BE15_47825 [Sorangium cellulosum]
MSTAAPFARRGFASSAAFCGGLIDGNRTGGGIAGGSEPGAALVGAGGSGLADGIGGAEIAGRDGCREGGGTTDGSVPGLPEGGIGGGSEPGLVPFVVAGGGSEPGGNEPGLVPFVVNGGGSEPGLVPFVVNGGGSDAGGSDAGGSVPGLVPFVGTGGGSDPGLVPFVVNGGGSGEAIPPGSFVPWFGAGGSELTPPVRVRCRVGGEGGTSAGFAVRDDFFASPSKTSRSLPPLVSAMFGNSSGHAAPFAAASEKRSRLLRATRMMCVMWTSRPPSRASSERAA